MSFVRINVCKEISMSRSKGKSPRLCSPQTGHTTLSSTLYRQLENQAPNTTGRNHLYNTLELLMMGIMVPETCWASNKICNKKIHLLRLVGILFPHIIDDARSKPHQIWIYLLNEVFLQQWINISGRLLLSVPVCRVVTCLQCIGYLIT
jgi:hypothetical protein